MNKKNLLPILVIAFSVFIISCSNSNKFKIEKGIVGNINTKTTVKN